MTLLIIKIDTEGGVQTTHIGMSTGPVIFMGGTTLLGCDNNMKNENKNLSSFGNTIRHDNLDWNKMN